MSGWLGAMNYGVIVANEVDNHLMSGGSRSTAERNAKWRPTWRPARQPLMRADQHDRPLLILDLDETLIHALTRHLPIQRRSG